MQKLVKEWRRSGEIADDSELGGCVATGKRRDGGREGGNRRLASDDLENSSPRNWVYFQSSERRTNEQCQMQFNPTRAVTKFW
jgi:hypothetical protein